MVALVWDNVGERLYETGVDHGVLYIPDASGVYANGVAWNGLTAVTESPSGAESTPQYADNIKYLNLVSAEEFGATIEAFTYPEEFAVFDGTAVPSPGISLGQQSRKMFGLSYRTRVGNDLDGTDHGYKLHLIYGCQAAPSEKAYATINDSPEAITFSWEVTTTPVAVTGYKPTAQVVLDSTKVDAATLATVEEMLYGTAGADPRLPLPDEIIQAFAQSLTLATPTQPTFATNTITIPTIAGVGYFIDGKRVSGDVDITADTIVTARPEKGYHFPAVVDTDWLYEFA